MTTVQLLSLITAAFLLQLATVLVVMFRRRRAVSGGPERPATQWCRPDRAWDGLREFRVTRRTDEDTARTQCSFYLQPVDGLALPDFRPGQFLTFLLDLTPVTVNEAQHRHVIARCYSLSDRPEPTHYRVTIKRVPAPPDHPEFPPGASSNYFHDQVRVGDTLRVKAPSGHFCIDPDPSVPVVLIGGGIGITPMMSMLRWCIANQPQRVVHLFYGLRNSDEHAFKSALEAMAASHPALQLHVVYSRPLACDLAGRDYQHAGHVNVELLRTVLPPGRREFYMCGPPAMMQTLVPALAEWGVPMADIHYEAFGPATVTLQGTNAAATPGVKGVDVQFRHSGRTLSWTGQDASLLDFAERHGIEVESGCRCGGCGSCETPLIEGSVQYDHTPDHDIAEGHCLLCVGRPAGSLVLEA